jgi:hypothetical protein
MDIKGGFPIYKDDELIAVIPYSNNKPRAYRRAKAVAQVLEDVEDDVLVNEIAEARLTQPYLEIESAEAYAEVLHAR